MSDPIASSDQLVTNLIDPNRPLLKGTATVEYSPDGSWYWLPEEKVATVWMTVLPGASGKRMTAPRLVGAAAGKREEKILGDPMVLEYKTMLKEKGLAP